VRFWVKISSFDLGIKRETLEVRKKLESGFLSERNLMLNATASLRTLMVGFRCHYDWIKEHLEN
jgi:hypothetical protein